MSKTEIITLGCRLNTYESEVMRRHADDAGLRDTVIVNTCAVTGEAVRQATQTIRRLRRERPDARIVVTGCAAQIDPQRFGNLGEVDHVIGNGEKMLAETFVGLATDGLERVVVNDIMSVRETAAHMIETFGTRARAYVQVQNGCDHRCTFCIIPYGRGPSRSVPMGDVVREVQGLVEAGYSEVVLTGVDMTSYGGDLPGEPKLGRLVQSVLKHVPELKRLRLSSIDQVEADADLMRALGDEERLMPHLHLSLQAGDDMILKRMKRRHTRAQAVDFCEEARRLRPDVVFGADIIAGFPTETDEMFENSRRLVRDCGLTHCHVFPFSPREGTPAARMPQLSREIVKARAAVLRREGQTALVQHLDQMIGRTVLVLMETLTRGRTPQFSEVRLPVEAEVIPSPTSPLKPGTVHTMTLDRHDGASLQGQLVVDEVVA
ncbi:MAG: tRNA (N(6)-L-threonylcarbamoyladenosine(37)-C(2))-methylthiotransferase MtaB [Pseudomonadota bacterium]